MYGFALLSSMDFRQTMRFAEHYHPLGTPLVDIAFSEQDGLAIWTISPLSHPLIDQDLSRQIVEMQFGIHTTLHRDVMGADFGPRELRLMCPTSDALDGYVSELRAVMRFAQPRNQFVFDAAWLDHQPALGNTVAFAAVIEICGDLVDKMRQGVGIVGRVRHLLLANMMQPTTFQQVAQHLGIGSRTLRRRLAEERTSFRQLVDELRRDTAIKYLRETEMTVEDVAYALGFSDPANFRHAFRRWTSSTPRSFRGAHGAADPDALSEVRLADFHTQDGQVAPWPAEASDAG